MSDRLPVSEVLLHAGGEWMTLGEQGAGRRTWEPPREYPRAVKAPGYDGPKPEEPEDPTREEDPWRDR